MDLKGRVEYSIRTIERAEARVRSELNLIKRFQGRDWIPDLAVKHGLRIQLYKVAGYYEPGEWRLFHEDNEDYNGFRRDARDLVEERDKTHYEMVDKVLGNHRPKPEHEEEVLDFLDGLDLETSHPEVVDILDLFCNPMEVASDFDRKVYFTQERMISLGRELVIYSGYLDLLNGELKNL